MSSFACRKVHIGLTSVFALVYGGKYGLRCSSTGVFVDLGATFFLSDFSKHLEDIILNPPWLNNDLGGQMGRLTDRFWREALV